MYSDEKKVFVVTMSSLTIFEREHISMQLRVTNHTFQLRHAFIVRHVDFIVFVSEEIHWWWRNISQR